MTDSRKILSTRNNFDSFRKGAVFDFFDSLNKSIQRTFSAAGAAPKVADFWR